MKSRRTFMNLGRVVAFAVIVLAWEYGVRLFQVPQFILPGPFEIAAKVVTDLTSGLILHDFGTTLLEVLAGFLFGAIAGVAVGAAVALVAVIESWVYPYILALQTVPKVAIAPLIIIWFGYGIQSKILMAALISFFPILVNVIAGLKTVDPRRLLLMRALRASTWQTFTKVRLPGMLPYLLAGLEIGIIFAVIGAIVAEFVGSSSGLGSLIVTRQSAIDVVGVFSVLVYLSVLGIALNAVLQWVGARFVFWARREHTPM
jgi:NitT/TauT family transport system permease protein